MTLNNYQATAKTTAIFPNDKSISYLLFGLCGETGEVADKFKKLMRDKDWDLNPANLDQETKTEIAKEIGDVLWYLAMLADQLGFSLEEIANLNIEKLQKRYNTGTLKGSGDNRGGFVGNNPGSFEKGVENETQDMKVSPEVVDWIINHPVIKRLAKK